ncbi:putative FACT complex subunit SSRP1 [Blattamonas nauphoetae]|uniref:FACT complex subunit SSRP1 n=1 Tax=Blattamonas nauphoetae TaxID=2049346 RepID=A0ABQ9Y6H9_9EUKA|nr:putative FACT complex subunit SSRP1 [Blattamonas nauphoetae]
MDPSQQKTEVQNIFFAGNRGTFTLDRKDSRFMFTSRDTQKTITLTPSDLQNITWVQTISGNIIKFYTKDNSCQIFTNFPSDFVKPFKIFTENPDNYVPLSILQSDVSGANWGEVRVDDTVAFTHDSKTILEFPAKSINQVEALKNTVTLFFQEPKVSKPNEESLVSIKFYVPGKDGTITRAESLRNEIKSKGHISSAAGERIASFTEIPFDVPRGRLSIEFYRKVMMVHGKTHTHTIEYRNITNIYALPGADQQFAWIMLSFKQPMRQGQTTYDNFVIKNDTHATPMQTTLNLTDEEIEQFGKKLGKTIDATATQTILTLVAAFTGKKIDFPRHFTTDDGRKFVNASHKSSNGQLYFFKKSLVFAPKPPIVVPFSDVIAIDFPRLSSSASSAQTSFDIRATLHVAPGVFEFTTIPRPDYGPIVKYLKEVGVKVKDTAKSNRGETKQAQVDQDDDSSDDEAYGESESGDSGSDESAEENKRLEGAFEADDGEDSEGLADELKSLEKEAPTEKRRTTTQQTPRQRPKMVKDDDDSD